MQSGLDDRRTLQFAPLWMLSGVTGTAVHHEPLELAAFWDVVVAVALRTAEPARSLLRSITEDRTGLLMDFELDERPVASGLQQVVAALGRSQPELVDSYKLALMRIGLGMAKARGPYGRMVQPETMQVLLLMAELLEFEVLPSIGDEALV